MKINKIHYGSGGMEFIDNIIFLSGCCCIALAVMIAVVSKIKKICYFKGGRYLTARANLFDYVDQLNKLLSSHEYISDEVQERLIEKCATSLKFFDKKPYVLPDDVLDVISKCCHIDEYIEKHRIELEFEKCFFAPFRVLMDKKSYVSGKQLKGLLNDAEKLVDLLSKEKDRLYLIGRYRLLGVYRCCG